MNSVPEGVILSEAGILEKDGIFFYSASDFARENLFYPMWGANYLCTAPYAVSHRTFDAFLLFYIADGELSFTCRSQSFVARAQDVVLLDCKYAHEYHAEHPVRFYWFHFRGAASQAYCDRLWERAGAHFPESSGSRTAVCPHAAAAARADGQRRQLFRVHSPPSRIAQCSAVARPVASGHARQKLYVRALSGKHFD